MTGLLVTRTDVQVKLPGPDDSVLTRITDPTVFGFLKARTQLRGVGISMALGISETNGEIWLYNELARSY